MLSGNSLRKTIHTHRTSVHQAAKLVAALLRIARVTAGLAESNGSLPPGLWLTSPAGWLPRTGISSRTLHSVIKYGLPLPFFVCEIRSKAVSKGSARRNVGSGKKDMWCKSLLTVCQRHLGLSETGYKKLVMCEAPRAPELVELLI